MQYTLTYSPSVDGWVSFYSYNPDYILGMNNYLYTFKGGNLYRHNVNNTRNTFYYDWWDRQNHPELAFTATQLQSVINTSPLENKLFKTINLEGDDSWSMQLETDLQYSGYIDANFFQKKEASYFAFIRNNSNGELALRSVNGIGDSLTVTGGNTVNFSINPLIAIGGIISIGDYIYFDAAQLYWAGIVQNVIVNYPAGVNQLIIDTSPPGTVPIPGNVNYFFYIKNSVAESHGVLGHYMTFTMQNYSSGKIELFTVNSEVMKSFP
jgi:hypothetical protein